MANMGKSSLDFIAAVHSQWKSLVEYKLMFKEAMLEIKQKGSSLMAP